jgi:SAM-dependent methyltransferase
MGGDKITEFTDFLTTSVGDCSFVRLVLSNYTGTEQDLKKVTLLKIIVKREEKLSFTYTYKTRDIVKNYTIGDACDKVASYLKSGFGAATLFTTAFDLSFPAMKKSEPSNKDVPPATHDIPKNRHIETKGKTYLHALGITDAQGNVLKAAQDKFRQIDKYIEILGGLIKAGKKHNIVDMGAGKGYLTFALYDYLSAHNIEASVTGVEYRKDLVDLCNSIAKKSAFGGLSFVEGTVENFDAGEMNILIALHACDTATDDAIAKGIDAGADLIVVAPCCHKQIRREIEAAKKDNDLAFITKYGTLLERQAEMTTDAMRGLLLEYAGYSVKLFEFISDTHTPKNVMIVAQKTGKKNPSALEKFNAAKAYFGIKRHHLEKALDL